MGLRTNVDISVQFGQDNGLTDLLFDRDVQSMLDTLDHATAVAVTLDGGETNFVVPFGDVEIARLLYIEADSEINVTLGGSTATKAQTDSVGGSYPTGFLGGEILTLKIDGTTLAVPFAVGDQSVQQVINRINSEAALLSLGTVAFLNGSQIRLKSLTTGTGSTVQVVSGSTGVLSLLGFTAGTVTGVNALAGTTPIQLRRPVATSNATQAAGVPVLFLATVYTDSITIDNVDPANAVQVRIALAGDLSAAVPC